MRRRSPSCLEATASGPPPLTPALSSRAGVRWRSGGEPQISARTYVRASVRRERDSNPRESPFDALAVFKTAPIDRSGIPPSPTQSQFLLRPSLLGGAVGGARVGRNSVARRRGAPESRPPTFAKDANVVRARYAPRHRRHQSRPVVVCPRTRPPPEPTARSCRLVCRPSPSAPIEAARLLGVSRDFFDKHVLREIPHIAPRTAAGSSPSDSSTRGLTDIEELPCPSTVVRRLPRWQPYIHRGQRQIGIEIKHAAGCPLLSSVRVVDAAPATARICYDGPARQARARLRAFALTPLRDETPG